MLPTSSINETLKVSQSLMWLRGPLLFSGMAWRVWCSLPGLLHWAKLNPWRKEDNVGLNTPVFYDEFRRLEAGRRLLNSLVGWEGGRQRSGHGSMGVQEVRGGPSGSSEGGAVINQEVIVQL